MRAVVEKRIVQFAWIVPVLFYGATMSHTVGYVDAALILHYAYFPNLSAWVNNHGLFALLGWLWMKVMPFGSEFLRLNTMSMLLGSFTVYVIFRTCLEYTKVLWISGLVAFALMTSQSLWWHSTMVEVYTLNTLLIALIFFAIISYYSKGSKYWLYAALLFWGLGVSNHVLMALFAPAFITLIIVERRSLKLADYGIGIACLLAGLTVFLIGFIRSYLEYHSFLTVLNLQTGGEFRSLMFQGDSRLFWRLNFLFLIIYQYPSLVIFYALYGFVFLFVRPTRFDLIVIAAIVPVTVWAANYFVWDMYAFSLPVYTLLAFPAAKGLLRLKDHKNLAIVAAATLAIPIFLYPVVSRAPVMRTYVSRYKMAAMVDNEYEPNRYFMNPEKIGFNDIHKYVSDLFATLPQGAWYYDNVFDYPIHYYYQDVRKERPDVVCPIAFVFWVKDQEVNAVSATIEQKLAEGTPVYVNRFVLGAVRSKLPPSRTEEIVVDGRPIFRLHLSGQS